MWFEIASALRGERCTIAFCAGAYAWQSMRVHTPGATSRNPQAFGFRPESAWICAMLMGSWKDATPGATAFGAAGA